MSKGASRDAWDKDPPVLAFNPGTLRLVHAELFLWTEFVVEVGILLLSRVRLGPRRGSLRLLCLELAFVSRDDL